MKIQHFFDPHTSTLTYVVHAGNQYTSREAYAAFREARDAEFPMPGLIFPSLQVNIRAGELPEPEGNGVAYLKLPLDFDCGK